MIVVLSAEAEVDLERIADHIATDNPRRAITFVQELLSRCHALADMPLAFPLVAQYAQLGIRRRVHGNYLIFYRVAQEGIEILHILHGAQDYSSLFSEIR